MAEKLLISDANVLIDMKADGLLARMFSLPVQFAVPDTLFEEELKTHHPELPGLGLAPLELRGESVEHAGALAEKHQRTGVSRNDLLALALAVQEQCPLLTGDNRLRMTADAEGIEVHGTLWLMEQLLLSRLIAPARAKRAYQAMRDAGRRLPWGEVEAQIKAFR